MLQSKPKPMHNRTRSHNAHLLDIRDEQQIEAQLARLGYDAPAISSQLDCFRYGAVKLQAVAASLLPALRSRIEELGGVLAVPEPAGSGDAQTSDVLLTGTYKVLGAVADRLREGPPDLAGIAGEIDGCLGVQRRVIAWNGRELDFRSRTYVMGIVNCTPDSFYPGSRLPDFEQAKAAAEAMLRAGADILDVGGESTRPGSEAMEAAEEIARVVPVIEALRSSSDILISVDTRKVEVAERALDAGADLVNDVSALKGNRPLAELVAGRGVPVILMHMRGEPKTMQENPHYQNAVAEILEELSRSVEFALSCGIPEDRIIVDPGIGFGKRCRDNLEIIAGLSSLRSLNCPVLMGVSRKSFIGTVLDRPVEQRLIGTVVANTLAILNGADIIRVHDVPEAVDTVRMIDAMRRGRC